MTSQAIIGKNTSDKIDIRIQKNSESVITRTITVDNTNKSETLVGRIIQTKKDNKSEVIIGKTIITK